MKNAGNPDEVSKARRKSDRRQRAIDNALKAMMGHRETRLWIFDLLEFCNLYRSSFATSGLVMAQNEGQRNVGLRLLADIMRVAPEQYVLMLTENKEPDDDGTDSESDGTSSERPGAESDPYADPDA